MADGVKVEDLVKQVDATFEAFIQWFDGFIRLSPKPVRGRMHKYFIDTGVVLDEFIRQRMSASELLPDDSAVNAELLLHSIEQGRIQFVGKKGEVPRLKSLIGKLEPTKRATLAKPIQRVEKAIVYFLEESKKFLNSELTATRSERERVDVTLPGRRTRRGHLHPITLLRQRIEDVFVSLGYAIEDDREIETDYYNFDALNIPEGHPARDPRDTFYTTDGFALRSQTSTVQIHAMERRAAPLRMIAPGRVFRRDTPDATHNPMFFQVEGLCVDKGITMAHLKGTLSEFVHRLFGPDVRTRFRPSYFPFTEPSAEVDYSCFKCGGTGCRICKGSGWIELGGSGMVHRNVLVGVGIDPDVFSGFAFGFGIDRMAALMYKLDDIRLLFENDVRFLEQFN